MSFRKRDQDNWPRFQALAFSCNTRLSISCMVLEKLKKIIQIAQTLHFSFFLFLGDFHLDKSFFCICFWWSLEVESRKKLHAVKKSSSACDNNKTEKRKNIFQLDIRRTTRSACRLFLGFMFRTVFVWAYKSDITKVIRYSLWYTFVKLSWKINLPTSLITYL